MHTHCLSVRPTRFFAAASRRRWHIKSGILPYRMYARMGESLRARERQAGRQVCEGILSVGRPSLSLSSTEMPPSQILGLIASAHPSRHINEQIRIVYSFPLFVVDSSNGAAKPLIYEPENLQWRTIPGSRSPCSLNRTRSPGANKISRFAI